MENATKALIIVATVLIAVLILAIGIYLFRNYSEIAYKNEENQSAQALIQYNNKFEKYKEKEMTIQDVLTIVNLAKDYNERKSEYTITVYLGATNLSNQNIDFKEFLTKYQDNKFEINGNFEYYSDGTIKEIRISKKT